MKTLVDPVRNLYQYRCDGPLCNPFYNPASFTPKSDYSKMMISCIYVYEENDNDYIGVQIQGWNCITTRTNILHICPQCTEEVIKIIKNKVRSIISEMTSIEKSSLEIANLLFNLDLYDV
jgi:hypothetical protein